MSVIERDQNIINRCNILPLEPKSICCVSIGDALYKMNPFKIDTGTKWRLFNGNLIQCVRMMLHVPSRELFTKIYVEMNYYQNIYMWKYSIPNF